MLVSEDFSSRIEECFIFVARIVARLISSSRYLPRSPFSSLVLFLLRAFFTNAFYRYLRRYTWSWGNRWKIIAFELCSFLVSSRSSGNNDSNERWKGEWIVVDKSRTRNNYFDLEGTTIKVWLVSEFRLVERSGLFWIRDKITHLNTWLIIRVKVSLRFNL